MLENHLSPTNAGATREHAKVKDSVKWLTSLQTSGYEVLDLGCGPGIYAELLAKKGRRVTGVDVSKRSIEHAQKSAKVKDLDIEYICEDYLNIELPANQFDIALLIYCDYGVLPPDDRIKLLKKVFSSLKPGGSFVVDVFSPAHYQSFVDHSDVSYETSGFWSDEPHSVITLNKDYPSRHYLDRYIVITESEYRSYNLWNHAFLDSELTDELHQAGFKDVGLYADVCGNTYCTNSEALCAVATKSLT